MQPPQMVLCIPGVWTSRSDLLERIIRDSEGYLFAGAVLMHIESKFACTLEFEEHDPRMGRAFWAAGPHWRDTPEAEAIGQHKSVVYLVGKGGSQEAAEAMMRCAAGILKAGGLGVKVESSGVAHKPQAWLEYVETLHLFSAFEALVVYVTGEQTYSCGMHNLGLPDAITDGIGHARAPDLLRIFNRYQFAESPELLDDQTFAAEAGATAYRLMHEAGVDYGDDSLYGNPYGCWRLTGIDTRQ